MSFLSRIFKKGKQHIRSEVKHLKTNAKDYVKSDEFKDLIEERVREEVIKKAADKLPIDKLLGDKGELIFIGLCYDMVTDLCQDLIERKLG